MNHYPHALPCTRCRVGRRAGGAALLALLAATAPATGSPVTAVNLARHAVCAPAAHGELRETRALDAVATQLARGESLHGALGLLPARPEFATSMHLVGLSDDRAIATAVADRYCRDLADPRLREVGIARTGNGLWIVAAAPLALPAPDDQLAISREIVARVNAARADGRRCGSRAYGPAAPLRLTASLSRVALEHATDMASTGLFDHQGSDGTSPAARVSRSGYRARLVGENIAAGVPTAAEVVDGWLASPEHCANILDGRFQEIGTGYAIDASSQLQIYWTQLLAVPR